MMGHSAMMNHTNCMNLQNLQTACEEPHKLRGSMKAQQECIRQRPGNDSVCILYNEMMSIYPRVCQIYTPSC